MKKGILRKAVSLVLALTLVIALAPVTVVFAADEVAYAGIKIEYPTALVGTQQTSNNYPGSGSPIDEITYGNSSGRVEWLSHTTNAASWNRSVLSLNAGAAGQYGAYKIRVPKAGKYDVTVQYRTRTGGAEGEMYILPITAEADIATALSSATLRVTVDFGTSDDATANTKFHETEAFSWTADKAGEYIVVWKAKESGSLRPANLIFDGQGTGNAPINAESELSKTSLNFAEDETATITTTSVTMSDLSAGGADDIASLTYESSDTNVVTVSGNVITAAGEGTAKVYTKSGNLVIAENEITVIVPEYSGVRAQYPTNPTAYNLATGTTTPANIKYNISGKRVDWYAYTGTYNTTSAPAWNAGSANFYLYADEYAAYKINIPEKGFYNVTLEYRVRTGGGTADMYLLPGNTKEEDIENAVKSATPFISGVNFLYSNHTGAEDRDVLTRKTNFDAKSAGEYMVVWMGTANGTVRPHNVIFVGCTGEDKNGLLGEITLSDTELVAGESATATASLNDAYTGDSVTGTITSSDSSILSVDGTTVTAKKAGTATLYAEVAGYGNKVARDVTVTASTPTELSGNVNFAAGVDISYKVGNAEAFAVLSANDVKIIPVGSEITVKVDDADNFAGWVRGTEDSENWISDESEYTFTIMSHTYLTPIYTETKATDAEQVVEFWNENKEYLGTSDVADGKATAPVATLTGHSFSAWHISDEDILPIESGSVNVSGIADVIIRAVAKHNAVNGFGTKIENNNSSATYWKRGDDIVAYGTSYDFYKWSGEPTITFGTDTVENKPLVVLDSTPVDGAYMIEYDKGNATEIVEAGILFGSTADINIGSTDGSKAASQRNGVDADEGDDNGHGQFCAKPNTKSNYDYARGYLIYKGTDNKLYVIYTAAIATIAAE